MVNVKAFNIGECLYLLCYIHTWLFCTPLFYDEVWLGNQEADFSGESRQGLDFCIIVCGDMIRPEVT